MRTTLALACLLIIGCVSTGQKGTLGFAYHADDNLIPLGTSAPLAVGSEANIAIYRVKSNAQHPYGVSTRRASLSLTEVDSIDALSATTSDPDVVRIVGGDGDIRIRGIARGTADITVRTAAGVDTIRIAVEETSTIRVDHWMWMVTDRTPADTVLLAGGVAHLWVERKDASGRTLVGDGLDAVLALEPEAGGELIAGGDHRHARIKLGEPGRVSVIPEKGTGLAFDVIETSEIDKLELVAKDKLLEVRVATADGRRVLGLDGIVQVTSETPTLCQPVSAVMVLGDGVYGVKRLAPGECRIAASIGSRTDSAVIVLE